MSEPGTTTTHNAIPWASLTLLASFAIGFTLGCGLGEAKGFSTGIQTTLCALSLSAQAAGKTVTEDSIDICTRAIR